jgi:hypothetical protein
MINVPKPSEWMVLLSCREKLLVGFRKREGRKEKKNDFGRIKKKINEK